MKFLLITVLFSVALAAQDLESYCDKMNEKLCDQFPRQPVCDTAGTVYRNKCDFIASWCKNDSLVLTKCAPFTPRDHKWYVCQFYDKEDCSRYFSTWTNKCDKKGNRYNNACEFRKAWCQFKSLELVGCPKEETVVSNTTTPAPIPNILFCEFYKKNNCRLPKFGLKDVCDQTGNSYSNECLFRQAWCQNSSLVLVDCEEHSGYIEGSGEDFDSDEKVDLDTSDSISSSSDESTDYDAEAESIEKKTPDEKKPETPLSKLVSLDLKESGFKAKPKRFKFSSKE